MHTVWLALAATACALLALLAARDGERRPLVPLGAPALALAAVALDAAVGLGALVALAMLLGSRHPLRARLSREVAPQLVSLLVVALLVLALPRALLPVPLLTRGVILGGALVANVLLAGPLARWSLGRTGRRVMLGLAAAAPAIALFAAVPLAARLGLLAQLRGAAVATLAAAAAGVVALYLLIGFGLLFARDDRRASIALAATVGATAGIVAGTHAVVLLVLPVGLAALAPLSRNA